jgi:osmotically-inducible protein OsmY
MLTAMAAGAALQYFLDPDRGRSRRVRAKDQAAAAIRRRRRDVERQVTYLENRVRGQRYDATHPDQPPENDPTLVDKVRSEVLGLREFRDDTILVEAADGVVTLRGQLPTAEEIDDVVQAVAKVTGVRDVQNYLHTPGTPPPNLT